MCRAVALLDRSWARDKLSILEWDRRVFFRETRKNRRPYPAEESKPCPHPSLESLRPLRLSDAFRRRDRSGMQTKDGTRRDPQKHRSGHGYLLPGLFRQALRNRTRRGLA